MSLLHPKNSNDAINNIRKSTDALLNSAEKSFESGTEIASDAIHNRMEPVVDLMAVTAQNWPNKAWKWRQMPKNMHSMPSTTQAKRLNSMSQNNLCALC